MSWTRPSNTARPSWTRPSRPTRPSQSSSTRPARPLWIGKGGQGSKVRGIRSQESRCHTCSFPHITNTCLDTAFIIHSCSTPPMQGLGLPCPYTTNPITLALDHPPPPFAALHPCCHYPNKTQYVRKYHASPNTASPANANASYNKKELGVGVL